MATFDVNVNVSVSTDQPPAGIASFTVPLFVGNPTFAERVRYYESTQELSADTDLKQPQSAAGSEGFSQSPVVATLGIGRADPDVEQEVQWTVVDDPNEGDRFELRCNGVAIEYTAAALDTAADVAAGLRTAAIIGWAGENVTESGAGSQVVLTADTPADLFSFGHTVESAVSSITQLINTAAYSDSQLENELDALLAEDDTWYAFTLQSQATTNIVKAAAWAQANGKLFIGQSGDPDTPSGGPGDPIAAIKALGYEQAACAWRQPAFSDQWSVFQWMCKTLACDPDSDTTIWAYKTLIGSSSDKAALSTTEKNVILANYGSVYLPFKSTPVMGMGRTASGLPLDLVVTKNWTEARVQEAIVQQLIAYSNRNSKIPYTDVGIAVIQATVQGVLSDGETIGHFTPESTSVTVPRMEDVSTSDKSNRLLRITFLAEAAGAIEKAIVNGAVVVDLT